MSLFSRLRGAMGFLQVGGPSGPGWAKDGFALDAKDSTDSTFVNVRGAAPVTSNDFVTLGSIAKTAATVTAGTSYNVLSTDTAVRLDTSGGSTCGAVLPATPLIGQEITFFWFAWGAGQIPPTVTWDGTIKLVPFAGMSASNTFVEVTAITTPGASFTLVYDGSEWCSR